MPTIARILVQLVVAGPIIIYMPFALLLGPVTLALALTGQAELSKGIAYGFGAFGLLGLYGSILVPLSAFHRVPAVRWLTITFLFLGIIASVVMAFAPGEQGETIAARPELFQVWLLGGPIVVAVWNLARLLRPPAAASTAPA